MADDPRIPDLWWSPTNHLYRGGTERPCADAVKLGDVERAETERDEAVALCANLQTTILSRLAELTEAAGKARSTEWLRTCATLPMEEWPPAPAYKGPMVPAADLERLQFLNGEAESTIERALAELRKRTAERDALQARVNQLEEQVAAGHRVQFAIAGQWLGHAAEKLDDGPAPEYLQRLAEWLTNGVEGDEPEPRVALQGDEPTEPKTEPPWFVVKHCCQAGAIAYPERCPWHTKAVDAPAEPTGEVDRG